MTAAPPAATTSMRAPQLCRAHPAAHPLEGTFQCAGFVGTRTSLLPSMASPVVRGSRPCGSTAWWRVITEEDITAGRFPADGWCTRHAGELLRQLLRRQCPQRAPLAGATAEARQAVTDHDGPDDPQSWATLRAANSALARHDAAHNCLLTIYTPPH